MLSTIKKNSALFFILKFLIIFAIFYFTCLATIGLSVKGGYYSKFVHDYLDFISLLRYLLLWGSKSLAGLFGYDTTIEGKYILRSRTGVGVRMVYQCIGYGIMSFWAAFVISNRGPFIKKVIWTCFGWAFIYFINILRISLLLISTINGYHLPFNWSHHTLFNIIAYLSILVLIIVYDKKLKSNNSI